ncbi:MAG: ATP-binding protein [Cyclobacteriaceae bacterium]|nr:ATP-binding protein [Flammeovirgaceae bacterium]
MRVLLVEDDEDDMILTKAYLAEVTNFTFEVFWESDLSRSRERMLTEAYDIFLVDYNLGRDNGLALIQSIQGKGVMTPSIILTGKGDSKVDMDASRFGVSDYLVKRELDANSLERSIRYALSQAKIVNELNEKEKKYRSLFERSVDAIFLANEKLELKDLNHAFLHLFGYGKLESESLKANALFAKENDYLDFIGMMKKANQVKDYEVPLMTKSGVTKACLLNCVFNPDPSTELYCYQGIIHDLTFRKQAENEMLNAERLSMTGKIARSIAHEVRNPLTNLNLALDQLRDELPKGNASMKLYSDIIERNAHRIEELVSEMLNSSRPKKLHLELTSIADIMEVVLASARDRINLHKIELQINYQPQLPRILVDREKMQVALLNIVINAVEAMETGKGILKISTSQSAQLLTISIADNGKGISPDDIGKLFDPFFTGKKSGMGLGLTSTKNILNSHNALIDVRSHLGIGTTFFIHFKLAE